jgi:hypothetical protein
MVRRFWLPTLGFLVLFSSPALGQKSDKRVADTLFREGREDFDKGDYARACPKFAESQRLDPAPGTLLNLAVCEEHLGNLRSARERLTTLLPQLSVGDERAPFARELLAKIDARLSRLVLSLSPGAPAGTEVKDAEGEVLPLGSEIVLEPGDRTLTVSAPGRSPSTLRLSLAAGQRESREVAPQPLLGEVKTPAQVGPTGPAPASAGGGPSALRLVGFASASVGVVALGVAAVSGAVLLSKKGRVDELCPNKQCSADGLKVLDDANRTPILPINTASWALAIAGVGVGATLIVLTRETAPNAPKAAAFVTALPGGGGFGVRGAF